MFDFSAGSWRSTTQAGRKVHDAASGLALQTMANGWRLMWSGPAAMQSLVFARATPTPEALPVILPIAAGATFAEDRFTCDAGSRRYLAYVPATAKGGITGLVVMLHGATQSPEDFAAGTGMNALADEHGFVVVYPHQSPEDQAQSCWNWFDRGDQQRDVGEPAILAGLTRLVIARHDIPADHVFVAGLSAGAAMAVILGETYPDIFSAVGAHSGLPAGAARNVPTAFAAMAGLRGITGGDGPAMRTSVFHGSADGTVVPSNGDRIALNAQEDGQDSGEAVAKAGRTNGRSFQKSTTFGDDGREAVEHWLVDGAGHAWSGGQASGSYTDTQGPDASAEMIRFFFAAESSEKAGV
ncbi:MULTISPECIES: PHB depolymerase family esterase [unclassified Yoonia]|uniref:extracellular catalytic domain type 1 short-chain-length polyhydroxyalkanoate depolymerase n=1 Tax=unclassified Yoonia TaxID=2629118 RepID=UPI002AFE9818|nr:MULTISPECIES: PHB depolymerase family esterase [unclassified Yoonia]